MKDKTDTNKVELNKVPYEVDGKTIFTEALKRVADEALRALGDD